MFELLKTLTEIPGMIGHEDLVQDYLEEQWHPYCQDLSRTSVGNLVGRVGGNGPKLLVAAHADEIGMLVKGVSPSGMIWLAAKNRIAGRPGRDIHMLGHKCVIQTYTELVEGVFATVVGHVEPPDRHERAGIGWGDFFVDIGAKSAAEVAEAGVQIGDGVVWTPETRRLRNYLVGKAMDDRAGLAIITTLLEKIGNKSTEQYQYELYVASTVQEELGLVGAHSLQNQFEFGMAIAIDVGLAGDVPGVDSKEINCVLGKGPIVVRHDGTVHYDRNISRQMADSAKRRDIEVQFAVFPRYSSDGMAFIQHGLPTGLLAFPARYTHSPYEMVAKNDLINCVSLLEEFILS